MDGLDVRWLAAPWGLLPLTALDWWIAWGRLPDRVVMKFGPNGQPSSWATRAQAMSFDLWLLGGILVFLTAVTLLAAFAQPEKASRVLLASAACGGFVFLLLNGVLWVYQVP